MKAGLIQIDARQTGGAIVPVRLCNFSDSLVCHLDGQQWDPALIRLPALRYDFFGGRFQNAVSVPQATFTVAVDALATVPPALLATLRFGSARVRVWTGEAGAAFGSYQLRFDGEIKAEPTIEEGVATFSAGAADAWMDVPLLGAYAGTGGLEGPDELAGTVKPLVLGNCRFVPGVLIDPVDNVYQVSAYGPVQGISAAFDRLNSLGASSGNYANLAALLGATIGNGSWATCLAQGLVRLGAPADGRPSFHVQGDAAGAGGYVTRAGGFIRRVLELAGGTGDLANLAQLDTDRPWDQALVLREQVTARSQIQQLADSVAAVSGITWTGTLFVKAYGFAAPSITLDTAGTSEPIVATIGQQPVDPPFWRLATNAAITWSVHSLGEIATDLVPRGAWAADRTYRADDLVFSGDGRAFVYINAAPSSGNAPPALPDTSNAWWQVAGGATRNDDGQNMLPNSGDPATWTFEHVAGPTYQGTGYAGMPNGWYAHLTSNNALVRFSDYVPVAGGETLYFSYTVASDHPVGAPVGQTVNASYSYKRADGSSAAVNLGGSPYNSSRDIAQMGSGIVVTVKFTVPLDAVLIQPYVERPVFTSYTVFVRAGAYLGRGEPGATANVVTYSAVAPSSPREGDLWVDTSGTYAVFKLRSGGTWVTGANALSVYNALSGRPIALADINTTESNKLTGIADKATRNDDGPNMLPTAGDQATWSFGGGAVPVNVTTGYAGMTNDWYAQLQSSGASVRFSDYIPCSPGETLYFSYIVASDYPVGPASGQTVNASYAYMRPDGSTAAVNLSSVSARDLSQMGGGTLVTAKFTVPIDAVKVQPYVERPTFAGYTAYVRRNAYLGRSAPGATNNSATINDDGSIKDGKVGTGALLASAVTTKSSAYTGGGLLISPGGYAYQTVQQLTLTSTGEPVHIIFSHAYYAIDNAKVKVQVWRDGTVLLTLNERNVSGGDNGGECMVFTDTPGAGTYTYYVKVGSNDNGDTTVYNRSIFALELKR